MFDISKLQVTVQAKMEKGKISESDLWIQIRCNEFKFSLPDQCADCITTITTIILIYWRHCVNGKTEISISNNASAHVFL